MGTKSIVYRPLHHDAQSADVTASNAVVPKRLRHAECVHSDVRIVAAAEHAGWFRLAPAGSSPGVLWGRGACHRGKGTKDIAEHADYSASTGRNHT
jgi:hypothetical protein